MAFSRGRERVYMAASIPSGMSHLAPGFTPASFKRRARGTPVQLALEARPRLRVAVSSGSGGLR